MILVCASFHAFAQITQQEAIDALAQRNIPEDTLMARLVAKGIDPTQIQPEDLPGFQKIVEQTISEIERDFANREKALSEEKATEDIIAQPSYDSSIKPEPSTQLPPKTDSGPADSGIYGHDIFGENSLFLKLSNTNVKPPDSYILGERDIIGISIFGASVENQTHEINKDGYITPSNQNRILLKGLTWEAAKESLRKNFSRYYAFNSDQFEATISYARNITVNVLGETKSKGSVVVPATNTVFNVLASAGGITEKGSVRAIKIISTSREQVIDLYSFLRNPSSSSSYFLSENDIVFVPAAQKIVEIRGAVVNPMRYELLQSENLKDVLDLAGGLNPDAYQKDIQIKRYIDDQRIVTNVNLREILASNSDYELYNGDEILITAIQAPVANIVTIEGAVLKPGQYEKTEDMRLSALIQQSVLKKTARLDFGYMLRFNADSTFSYERININQILDAPGTTADPILRARDQIVIQEQAFYADAYSFQVTGAVRSPGSFDFNPSSTLNIDDAILLSGGLLPDAAHFAFVIRRMRDEPKTVDYIPVNVQSVLANPGSPDNIALMPDDIVRIASKANYRDEFYIKVSGAVRQPGIYEFDPKLQLTDFLKLAGGLKFSAATNKIDISRVVFRENEPTENAEYTVEVDRDLSLINTEINFSSMMPFDHIYVREIPDFELQQTVILKGEVRYPGEYSLISDNERLESLIDRAGGLTEEANADAAALFRANDSLGFVVIHMNKALKQPNSVWNIILEDRDTVFVPKQEDLVLIEGAINATELYKSEYLNGRNQIAVNFEGEKNALYYVNEYAAGLSDNGSKKRITVEQPNGKIEKSKSFLFFRSYPKVQKGATITVGKKPPKVDKEVGAEKEPVDWNSVLRDVVTQATTILTLVLLVNNINK